MSKITKKSFLTFFLAIFLCSIFGCEGEYEKPIHDAILRENMQKVEELLNAGVDVDETDVYGRTSLYLAALQGSKEIVEFLISRGAKIEKGASGKSGRTPLHVAAREGYIDVVALLIDNGANVNFEDSAGMTSLHHAAWHIHPETVEYLLNKGAEVNVRANNGFTPLHHDMGGPQLREGDTLQEYVNDYTRIVGLLIAAGADVNDKAGGPTAGYTPLMSACIVGAKEAVELMIDNGADVNPKSKGYKSPLGMAITHGHKDIEEVLRKHGAK